MLLARKQKTKKNASPSADSQSGFMLLPCCRGCPVQAWVALEQYESVWIIWKMNRALRIYCFPNCFYNAG